MDTFSKLYLENTNYFSNFKIESRLCVGRISKSEFEVEYLPG